MKLPSNAHIELHTGSLSSQQNWLRAGVLGANDGIVSVAALIVGVAGATADIKLILITGVAGMTAGALSMAAGEYVSVSSQRDTEKALLEKERRELAESPAEELEELTVIYEKKGLARPTAETVARELTAHDAFTAHVEAELGIHAHDLTNPWHAAIASGFSFVVGALIPLAAILISPAAMHLPATFIGVIIALAITGYLSARVSDAPPIKVVTRVVIGGAIAMAITFGIGTAFGIATA
jgi:VIT1/CCC1 family predicted Fe2+/Mn2+ transporter